MTPFDTRELAQVYRYRVMDLEHLKKLIAQHEKNAAVMRRVVEEREGKAGGRESQETR